MKKIILEIEFDDTNGYKGHGDDTYELIKSACENEITIGLEHDGVIKEGWKINVIDCDHNEHETKWDEDGTGRCSLCNEKVY